MFLLGGLLLVRGGYDPPEWITALRDGPEKERMIEDWNGVDERAVQREFNKAKSGIFTGVWAWFVKGVGLVTRTQPRYHKLYCRVTRLSNRTASQHPDVQMGLLHDSLPPLLISGETRLGTEVPTRRLSQVSMIVRGSGPGFYKNGIPNLSYGFRRARG